MPAGLDPAIPLLVSRGDRARPASSAVQAPGGPLPLHHVSVAAQVAYVPWRGMGAVGQGSRCAHPGVMGNRTNGLGGGGFLSERVEEAVCI